MGDEVTSELTSHRRPAVVAGFSDEPSI